MCPINSYCPYNSSARVPCANFSHSVQGQAQIGTCYCDAGYYGNAGITAGSCKPCTIGGWCIDGNIAAPTSCPPNSTSPAMATVQTACICDAGFTGPPGGPCAQCPLGSYIFTNTTTTLSQCSICPAGTYSSVWPTYYNCTACPAGTYLGTTGSVSLTSCTACAAGKYSASIAAIYESNCTFCPPGTASTTAGANTTLGVCWSCPPGSYSTPARQTCQNCTAGSYQASNGMIDNSSCIACYAGSWSATVGAPGNGSCLPCGPGTFSNSTGLQSLTGCSSCQAGTFQTGLGFTSVTACQVRVYACLTFSRV